MDARLAIYIKRPFHFSLGSEKDRQTVVNSCVLFELFRNNRMHLILPSKRVVDRVSINLSLGVFVIEPNGLCGMKFHTSVGIK